MKFMAAGGMRVIVRRVATDTPGSCPAPLPITHPQDATLRNVKAAARRLAKLELKYEKILKKLAKVVRAGR